MDFGHGNLWEYLGFNYGSFRVVAGLDNNPEKIGKKVASLVVRSSADFEKVVRESGAETGVLAVPAEATQQNYDAWPKRASKESSTSPPCASSAAPTCR